MSASVLPYPFELGFMQRALIGGLIVGIFAPMIGTYLVQRRLSLIGDGIGHVAFAGVGLGLLFSIGPLWSALLLAVGGALAIEWLRSRRRASGDLALALLFYSGIALGVIFASLAGGMNGDLLKYLFGQPLTVDRDEIVVIARLGIVVAVIMWALRRPLFAVVTDEEWSRVAGLPVGLLNALLASVTAFTVVAAMRIVGILLIAALMVLPVASAQLLARSFRGTLTWATGIGALAVVTGLAVARIWDLAPSGAIVLVAAGTFGIVSIAKRAAPRALRLEEHQ
ncbi:MAG: metal ABC transporter permease [Actinomycetota bacterium]|nr:metal ABC transporter permease [Actinomycetota bacterium]